VVVLLVAPDLRFRARFMIYAHAPASKRLSDNAEASFGVLVMVFASCAVLLQV